MFWYTSDDLDMELIGCTIYVPTESVDAYKTDYSWSDYYYYIVGYDFE